MTVSTTIDAPRAARTNVGRWIWFFSASLFFVIAVVGFLPRSVQILAGALRNPPLVVHIHAALIFTWLGLVVVQSWLVARGHTNWHRTLGITAFTLGPALVISMIAVTIWRFGDRVAQNQIEMGANILLSQMRACIYFPIFFAWAMFARKRDPETHKRMILLASFVPFGAAFTRMTWLPTTMPEAYTSIHVCLLLLLVPAITYDIVRYGRPHAAWIKGLALLLPWMVFTELMWNNPWWLATATRLMGY